MIPDVLKEKRLVNSEADNIMTANVSTANFIYVKRIKIRQIPQSSQSVKGA